MPCALFREYRTAALPKWTVCDEPLGVLEARRPEEVLPALAAVERAVQAGAYAAGFLAYEAAPGLDDAFCTHDCPQLPLIWFGLFGRLHSQEGDCPNFRVNENGTVPFDAHYRLGDWQPSLGQQEYEQAIDRIKDYIARGDTYQVNYTFRLRAAFDGDPWPLFLRLCRAQQARYAAYIDTGRHVLCSASPELFFRLDGEELISRPMKGTSPRGRTCREDAALREALAVSPKERAENAMIVDMMRNDLGRIARRGSVEVRSAFDVEKYPTLLQMTSTVAAKTAAPLVEIFQALFPPASITGAPKVRTMQIIRELEPDARGVYTGSIGYLAPRRQAQFNVAIRTVAIDRRSGQAEYGVGGGIVWDSSKAGEYAECRVKAAVLTADVPEFELLETMLYQADSGYFLLEKHLERLAESAAYFDFPLDMAAVRSSLEQQATSHSPGKLRVRLRLARDGRLTLETEPLSAVDAAAPRRLKLAPAPVDSRNAMLFHKTTWRKPYDAAYAARGDCDDVVLWNEKRQATETTICNLVIERAGRLVTPPVGCGLLAGVFRAHLIETGQLCEEVVTIDDLRQAERVLVINSLRKWLPAVFVSEPFGPGPG